MTRLVLVLTAALPLAAASPAPAQKVIYLARHAEKDTDPSFDREDDRRPLTAVGKGQAEALARRLADAGVGAVYYSSVAKPDGSRPIARTYATADPLISALRSRGVRVETRPILYPDDLHRDPWDRTALQRYARAVLDRISGEQPDGVVLIVGHENTVPAILEELARGAGREIPTKDMFIAPREFNLLFTVVPGTTGQSEFFRRSIYAPAASPVVPNKSRP